MQHPEQCRKEHSNRVHPKATLKEPLKVSLTACILLFALSHMISTGYCYTHAVEPHRQQQRHRSELDRCRDQTRDTKARAPPQRQNKGVAKYYTLKRKSLAAAYKRKQRHTLQITGRACRCNFIFKEAGASREAHPL